MQLTSDAFTDQGRIPDRFTCSGEDVSPPLAWTDVPEGTVDLAITCEDPDAPSGTFVHWVVWNIPPSTAGLGPGEIPPAAQHGRNDFGASTYRGPCPPRGHGTHHYHFTLHALGQALEAPRGARLAEVRRAMAGRVLATATIVGTFDR